MSVTYQEIQLLAAAVITANANGASVSGQAISRPYSSSTGYNSACFHLECTAVAASGIADIKVQGKTNNGTNWFDLIDQNGKPVAFTEVTAANQSEYINFIGVIPANLRAVSAYVSGTSVTVNLNVALGG